MVEGKSYLEDLGKRLSHEIRVATKNNSLMLAYLLGMALMEVEAINAEQKRSRLE